MKIFLIIGCILIWGLNIFDYMSTSLLLENGGTEWNPFMNWMMGHFGSQIAMLATKIPFLILVLVVTIHAIKKDMTRRERILVPVCYTIVIVTYAVVMYMCNYQCLLAFRGPVA